MRWALKRMLEEQPGVEVVAEAADGLEALELCQRLRPEMVLMDIGMPEMDGLAATRVIKRDLPRTAILIITALEDPSYLSEALKAGAAGYVPKHAPPWEITEAIRKVLAGESSLDHTITVQLLRRLLEEEQEKEAPPPFEDPQQLAQARLLKKLAKRELEVLRLVARGRTNQQIAQSLLVSVSTVKKHVRNIISKLGVSDRVQAAVKAIELGLLDDQVG